MNYYPSSKMDPKIISNEIYSEKLLCMAACTNMHTHALIPTLTFNLYVYLRIFHADSIKIQFVHVKFMVCRIKIRQTIFTLTPKIQIKTNKSAAPGLKSHHRRMTEYGIRKQQMNDVKCGTFRLYCV